MAIATRPRPKVQHKKRAAKHHRKSKVYLKPYHPYLPVLGILALGYVLNRVWPSSLVNSSLVPSNESVTRVEALTGNSSSLVWIIIIAASAFALYMLIHWYRIRRLLNRGEHFVVDHPWWDVILAALFTLGIVLTRSAHP